MQKLRNKDFILTFLGWRTGLFILAALSMLLIPEFGARFPYYQEELINTGSPVWIWGFGNFDGVHYLRLAKDGYQANFTQVFFPLYPLLIKLVAIGGNYLVSGLILSNLFLAAGLYFLFKLFLLDYDIKTSKLAVIFLLLFPTAFYWGSVYSESLFLLLTTLSFYFVRKKRFFIASLFASLSSITRIFGILLTPILVVEFFRSYKLSDLKNRKILVSFLSIFIAPLGLVIYMIYLQINFGDSLYFLNAQQVFGAQRSSTPLILLPQVFYRYLKILISVPVFTLPFFNSLVELIFTVFMIFLIFISFKKVRLSYLLFTVGCLLLPTLTGTLSSMPRYALMGFLLFPILVGYLKSYLYQVGILFIILQAILLMMFIRGYWVS